MPPILLLFLASMFLFTGKVQAATCAELCGGASHSFCQNACYPGRFSDYWYEDNRACWYDIASYGNASDCSGKVCCCGSSWWCNDASKPAGCVGVCNLGCNPAAIDPVNPPCQITVVGGEAHSLNESITLKLKEAPVLASSLACYYQSLDIKLASGETACTVSGLAPSSQEKDCVWSTQGKPAGTYQLSVVYGGHNDYNCCDRGYTCTAQVVLGAAACPWDLNHDGTVNGADVTAFNASGCYQPLGSGGGDCSSYNFGGSATINALDYSLLLTHWGSCPTP